MMEANVNILESALADDYPPPPPSGPQPGNRTPHDRNQSRWLFSPLFLLFFSCRVLICLLHFCNIHNFHTR